MRQSFFLAAMLILATGFLCGGCGSGYDSSLKPTLTGKIGKFCTVQFRRDALGAAANLPVPPLTGVVNGAEVSVSGKLLAVTPRWIVLQREAEELHIPVHAVLMVRTD